MRPSSCCTGSCFFAQPHRSTAAHRHRHRIFLSPRFVAAAPFRCFDYYITPPGRNASLRPLLPHRLNISANFFRKGWSNRAAYAIIKETPPGSARFHLLPRILATNSGSINWTSRILRISRNLLEITGRQGRLPLAAAGSIDDHWPPLIEAAKVCESARFLAD